MTAKSRRPFSCTAAESLLSRRDSGSPKPTDICVRRRSGTARRNLHCLTNRMLRGFRRMSRGSLERDKRDGREVQCDARLGGCRPGTGTGRGLRRIEDRSGARDAAAGAPLPISRGWAGPSNPRACGLTHAQRNITGAVREAFQAAGREPRGWPRPAWPSPGPGTSRSAARCIAGVNNRPWPFAGASSTTPRSSCGPVSTRNRASR